MASEFFRISFLGPPTDAFPEAFDQVINAAETTFEETCFHGYQSPGLGLDRWFSLEKFTKSNRLNIFDLLIVRTSILLMHSWDMDYGFSAQNFADQASRGLPDPKLADRAKSTFILAGSGLRVPDRAQLPDSD